MWTCVYRVPFKVSGTELHIFLEHVRAYYLYLDMSNNYGYGRRSERSERMVERESQKADMRWQEVTNPKPEITSPWGARN